jgi:hypothetical protein
MTINFLSEEHIRKILPPPPSPSRQEERGDVDVTADTVIADRNS